ncbi:hypothetical protein D3C72_544740 [compost metagenome]
MSIDTTFLEQIRQTEYEQLDRFTRFVSSIKMSTTRDMVGWELHVKKVGQKVYKPSRFSKWVYFIAVGLLLIVYTISWKERNSWVIWMFILLFLGGYINDYHIKKSLLYTITLNAEGVEIKDVLYKWCDICVTAIMSVPQGKGRRHYLIIGMNNRHTYEKFDLCQFATWHPIGFAYLLSEYIEYFKPKKVQGLTD